jgi:hypothetical protein
MLNVVVVDAQGGGLGAAIVKKLIENCGERIYLTALGTNSAATAAMKKSGSNDCATGENAICFGVRSADIIIGGIGIIAASGMLGEITPRIARAISECGAKKVLIPISRCNYYIPGADGVGIAALIDAAVAHVCTLA